MIRSVVAHLERRAEVKANERLAATADALEALWASIRDDDDDALRRRFDALRTTDVLAFESDAALVCAAEAVRRRLGVVVRRGQLLAARHMARGEVVELATGEGKTLAIVMAALARTRVDQSVHVLTQNDYLASRDARLAQRVARFLGVSVGVVGRATSSSDRRAAYLNAITYAGADVVVFDAMRDARASRAERAVVRRFDFAIIDEIDSILIDAATLPLVLGRGERSSAFAPALSVVVAKLEPELDFEVDVTVGTARFTERGYDALTRALHGRGLLQGSLFDDRAAEVLAAAQCALDARAVFHANEQYIVDARSRVVPLDRTTGRANPRRRFGEGVQAAIEAKEGVPIRGGSSSGDTTTYGVFIANYRGFAGATGTLTTLETEFETSFHKTVVRIPRDAPSIRIDEPDRFFETDASRLAAVVLEVERAHAIGQPVLVAATTESVAEVVARMIEARGLSPRRLTAKNPRDEAAVIADAASLGAITVATQVAGRGTDIVLGGRAADAGAAAQVAAAGGLLVIGVEHQRARRIDAQLRGRAGRRGDPGRTVYFVSLEDELVRRYATDAMRNKALEAHRRGNASAIARAFGDLVAYVVSRAEDAEAGVRRQRAAFDARRVREERVLAEVRARLRVGAIDLSTRASGTPLLARGPLRRRVAQIVARNVALAEQARAEPGSDVVTGPLGVRPRRLLTTLGSVLGVELDTIPEYASLDALTDTLTDAIHVALEARLDWILSLAGPARRREVLAKVRRGRPWAVLLVFRNAYLDALDTHVRAHVDLSREEERTLGLTAMAERSPERVLELRGHERFQSLLAEVGEVALAALLAGGAESDTAPP